MPSRKSTRTEKPETTAVQPVAVRVKSVLATLERMASKQVREGMARYAIPNDKAFGIPVGELQKLAKRLGRDHALALALWESGFYEARLLASFVDEPARVTPAQMDRWCRAFDNWAVCDTACFHLFDRTPHAFAKVERWATRKPEFERRAAFALLASIAGHDKQASDAAFLRSLPLIAGAADDPRNFVKKAVSWALRRIGTRNEALKKAALALAKELAASEDAATRWVGKDALRDLSRAKRERALGTKA
jgi:3-methyladenine DNA glycosylase AlkD